ncbi:MAG: FAD-dependent oxidoreductase [Pseudomonadota bacterium]
MTPDRTLVIGAGMAGLACARELHRAGHEVLVLDKGRGIGGRLATRRSADGFQFDHGAQYVTAQGARFRGLLALLREEGAAAFWDDGSGRDHLVGVPGMSALGKVLGRGLAVHQKVRVTAIEALADGWRLVADGVAYEGRRVVVTAPAPQAAALLGPDSAITRALAPVRMAPCLTLMARFESDQPPPFISRRDPEDPLSWIAYDSAKPQRPGPGCWVAQAGPDWSSQHLEEGMEETARALLALLCDRLGTDPATAVHAAAHRWRYANVVAPLGQPFLRDETGSLYTGGDWCLGARVEAAWTSGTAIAQSILAGS